MIDPDNFKQIILNDSFAGYKPGIEVLERLRILFPDIIILGFGRWNYTPTWYLIANSTRFPKNLKESDHLVSIHEAVVWAKPKIIPYLPVFPTIS